MTLCELPIKQLDGLAGYNRISIQWQKTCSNWKDTVQAKLWKTPMERRPCGSNRNSTSRRISYWNIEELGTGNKGNERSVRKDEEAV